MKIYILAEITDYQGSSLFGVFSTKQKAIEAIPKPIPYGLYLTDEDIYEFELDDANLKNL